MSKSTEQGFLRFIPSIDQILADPEIVKWARSHPHFPWTRFLRELVGEFRSGAHGTLRADRDAIQRAIVEAAAARMEGLRTGGMRRVINGTGVVLHTNLGRALPGKELVSAVREAMEHYVNLEIDLDLGRRSHRGETLVELIRMATGGESAMVVNNNAAAVYLAVNSYSPPGRIIISRGELVEIGGSFRLPDILSAAAAEVIEVGTTNRTYIKDYAAVAREGDILMRAHRSNYEIQGFTHDTTAVELVDLSRQRGCHVLYDLGSGSLFDFAGAGIEGEERVQDVLDTGVDCVTMSGDKLLGGVQAGIIVGRREFLDKLTSNPLRRALRIDKTTIAALQALMRIYLFAADPSQDVPALQQSTVPVADLRVRAAAVVDRLPAGARSAHSVSVVDDDAAVGGGSFASAQVASVAIALQCDSEKAAGALARRLRNNVVPILSRIKGSEVRLNFRSIPAYEDDELSASLAAVLGGA